VNPKQTSFPLIKSWAQRTSFRFRASLCLIVLALFYIAHFLFCTNSALPEFVYYFTNSDMNANLQWANTIRQEGWLNPHPYHPYNDWMQEIAPYEKWVEWWGGEAIFQQSPLFAYLLAAFLNFSSNLLIFQFAQCLSGVLLCGLLAILAATVFEDRAAGWITLLIAGLYGPFYGYSWPLLRDFASWTILVLSILLLTLWCRKWRSAKPGFVLSGVTGAILGLGLLARETFYLIIPLVLIALFLKSVQQRNYRPFAVLAIALAAVVSPLVFRNAIVGTPWFSSSNRFIENFIEGNAASAKPASLFIPYEMGDVLNRSGGKTLPVIQETLATHQADPTGWWALQIQKMVALFDPYEPPDNLSLYYLADISPFVRWGFPHWLILIPGLGGFLLGLWKRDRRQGWMWLFLFCLLANLLLTTVLSRYRQSLALLWIPWAGYFLSILFKAYLQKSHFKLAAACLFLLAGWWTCLKPLAIRPPKTYHRSTEYRLAAVIYEKRGRPDKARESLEKLRKKVIPDL
jgi:4-amino-4-deoxy-L-arabinose transferase-like glycosyltransferase